MKQTLLILGTYSVENAEGGGKYVAHNLFTRLSKHFNIIFLSLVESDKIKKEINIIPSFQNIIIPQNKEQASIQWEEERKNNVTLHDYIQIDHWHYNIDYLEQVKKFIDICDVIILEHPFLANLVKSFNTKIPIIYHAHNVELIQKSSILKPNMLKDIERIEMLACTMSEQIWVASESEGKTFTYTYHINKNKIKLLPHGVDLNNTKFIDRKLHDYVKSQTMEFRDKTIFVFTGSWHPPNLEALQFIISELAPIDKNYLFFVIGGVKDYYYYEFKNSIIPQNIILLGRVTEDEKNKIYELADFAINPMFSGAGTNLKMLEYMACGMPIISTDFGARGIEVSTDTLVCKKEDFKNYAKNILSLDYKNSKSIQENYELVSKKYDYEIISQKCLQFLNELNHKSDYLNQVFHNVVSELNNMSINGNDLILDAISKEIESILN